MSLTAEELRKLEKDPTANFDLEAEDAPSLLQQKVCMLISLDIILTSHSSRSLRHQYCTRLHGLHVRLGRVLFNTFQLLLARSGRMLSLSQMMTSLKMMKMTMMITHHDDLVPETILVL